MALIDNLISYWKLEEASGTRVDAHSTNDLTDNNTVTQAAGIIDNAAVFDDANDEYLSHADNAALSVGASNFSLQFWLYPTVLSAADFFGGKATIFSNTTEWKAATDAAGDIDLTIGDGSSNVGSNLATVLTVNTWSHVVLIWDGTDQWIYHNDDGSPDQTANANGSHDNGEIFAVGQISDNEVVGFTGRIDEVGFWKKALTSGEVTELYNGGSGLAYPFVAGLPPNRVYQVEQAINRAGTY